jgi:hypothetical protein
MAKLNLYTGESSQARKETVDDTVTLNEFIRAHGYRGSITLNGVIINVTENGNKQLKDFVQDGDSLNYANKNGGNF